MDHFMGLCRMEKTIFHLAILLAKTLTVFAVGGVKHSLIELFMTFLDEKMYNPLITLKCILAASAFFL